MGFTKPHIVCQQSAEPKFIKRMKPGKTVFLITAEMAWNVCDFCRITPVGTVKKSFQAVLKRIVFEPALDIFNN